MKGKSIPKKITVVPFLCEYAMVKYVCFMTSVCDQDICNMFYRYVQWPIHNDNDHKKVVHIPTVTFRTQCNNMYICSGVSYTASGIICVLLSPIP
jgi:hypothetical protein